MSHDEEHADPNGDGPQSGASDGERPGSGKPSLPPPAFPPGDRRHQYRRRDRQTARTAQDGGSGPSDGSAPGRDNLADAFISPDEPLPERSTTTVADHRERPEEEVMVTGMGHDAHLDPQEMAAAGDPYVMELTEKVGKLAQALKQKGEAGLHGTPEMDRFEATLRGYCVGYLAGRRADHQG